MRQNTIYKIQSDPKLNISKWKNFIQTNYWKIENGQEGVLANSFAPLMRVYLPLMKSILTP